ncbi:MAG: tetratricopeptide repeat protein, partial [Prevotellaceae bacterium]|nr:tetratricopeptide repeat protein [Prevotellaceae bacterium]
MINKVQLDNSNNNVIIQEVAENGSVTINTVHWNDFVNKYTIEQRKRIEELEKLLSRSEDLFDRNRMDWANEREDLLKQITETKEQIRLILEQKAENPSKLYEIAYKYFIEGDIDKALETLNDAKLNEQAEKLADEYILKARLLIIKNDYANAEKYFTRAVEIFPSFSKHLTVANYFHEQRNYPQAETYYQQCLEKAETEYEKGRTLNNLAILHYNTNALSQAENEYNEALEIRRTLANTNPAAYLPDVAVTLNNLAVLHWNTNALSQAENEYNEALEIRRTLANTNSAAYLPDVATTLNNLALLHYDTNAFSQAENEYNEALEIIRTLAKTNPAAYLPGVATTLNNLAILHYNTNALSQAENEYNEALEIRRTLANTNPAAYLPDVAVTLNNLANLHYNTNALSQAENEYNEALEIRRTLANTNPAAYLPDV